MADLVGFEGEADVTIDIPSYDATRPVPMFLHLKGAKMRTEYGAGTHLGEIQLRDEREKKAWLLLVAKHTYTESPILPSKLPPSTLPRPRGTSLGTAEARRTEGHGYPAFSHNVSTNAPRSARSSRVSSSP